MRFTGLDVTASGVRERHFEVDRPTGVVPGSLWTPEDVQDAEPLVLIGHGASGSKQEGYVVALARRLVRHAGFAAAAIDGPFHGDRRSEGADSTRSFLEFSQAWAGDPGLTDRMVADWRAALDGLQGLDEIGAGPVGYWGLSMGTIFGLPLVAAEPRVRAAVLGLMGLTGPSRERIAADAPAVTCPILFLTQWHDELFRREAAMELFDMLGSTDKRLHANPGTHGQVPEEEFAFSERFLTERLQTS